MLWGFTQQSLGYVAFLMGMIAGLAPCQGTKNVKVTVVVILANKTPNHIDPKLVHIAKEVQKKNPKLKCFKLQSICCQSLPVDKKTVFKLVENQQVEITIKQAADKNNRVVLCVKAPLQGEIEYEAVCGKFLPIVTRYQTPNGDRLILAIRVQPCHGEK